jgi:hypothetical protein
MNIKTKYNIGDTVYFMARNYVTSMKIGKITVEVDEHRKESWIEYISDDGQHVQHESDVFPDKASLLKGLFPDYKKLLGL